MTIGEIIKRYRTENDLSMDNFGKLASLSKAYISVLERGSNPRNNKPVIPSIDTLRAIAQAMGMDLNKLISLLDDNQKIKLSSPEPPENSSTLTLGKENNKLPEGAFEYNPTHKIPILGYISAGLPLYAEQHIEGYTYTELNGDAEYFGLIVKGDSMNAAMIYPGATLIVRRQESVENGEIAVVMVNDENATVKQFRRENDMVILEPKSTNPIHQTQIYSLKNTKIRIIGKVVEVKYAIQ